MFDILRRETIYLWYFLEVQLRQILPYYFLGIILGSIVSVFLKQHINNLFLKLSNKKIGNIGIVIASFLGILSPLCMYGTIPLAASFKRSGIRDEWLGAFMMSSILLNPQLIIYSAALGFNALVIRIFACFLCGIFAGLLIYFFFRNKEFFSFGDFREPVNRDTDPNMAMRFIYNIGRNIKATYFWFFIGILLSAVFQRYIPSEQFASLFGKNNEGFGLLMAATIGVPLYTCGGGTIPLLREWLLSGMSMGSATSFMLTGPSTKITNLGALKIVLGSKHFFIYIIFICIFSLLAGFLVNLLFV